MSYHISLRTVIALGPFGLQSSMVGPAMASLCSPCIGLLFFFQAEDGIRDGHVTGVQTCALPISPDDIERLRTPLPGPRSLVVLGCTGGAGQTVTTLMIGHTLAQHRDDRVTAVDVNPGPNGLSRRVGAQASETLTALLANTETVTEYEQMRSYVDRSVSGLEVVQTLDDPYVQTLDDRDYGRITELLGGFYDLTLLDPAATGVSRALPVADGLVLVAPASADAERAVSMTFEWLDGNGYSGL